MDTPRRPPPGYAPNTGYLHPLHLAVEIPEDRVGGPRAVHAHRDVTRVVQLHLHAVDTVCPKSLDPFYIVSY